MKISQTNKPRQESRMMRKIENLQLLQQFYLGGSSALPVCPLLTESFFPSPSPVAGEGEAGVHIRVAKSAGFCYKQAGIPQIESLWKSLSPFRRACHARGRHCQAED